MTHDILDIVGDSRSNHGGGINDNDDSGNGDNSYYCHRVVTALFRVFPVTTELDLPA